MSNFCEVHMKGRKGLMLFCCMLFVSILLPTAAMANKRLYKATVKDPGNRRVSGSSIILTMSTTVSFNVFLGNANSSVTDAWLVSPAGTNLVPLCGAPDAPVPVCEFDAYGNLEIDGTITNTLLFHYGVNGADFFHWLDNGEMSIVIHHGGGSGAASGVYTRIFP
jgi:hypothetical protein